ncbi:MAG: hypothetical protein ACI9K5_001833 [Gammaproteobacteria bacterium]|jgi:hypothetical protein
MDAIIDLQAAGPPPEVVDVLPKLLSSEVPEGVAVLKPGAVYRVGATVVKLYRRGSRRFVRLRPPQAQRAVRSYHRLLPVRSPKPLHWDRLGHADYDSLLVYEYVEGSTLLELWKTEASEWRAALPQFLADLFATRVLHADLHAGNLLWGPDGWVLLDLDGIRHGLHGLRRRTITEKTWARLLFDFKNNDAGEILYREFHALAKPPWGVEKSWARILGRAEENDRIRAASGR